MRILPIWIAWLGVNENTPELRDIFSLQKKAVNKPITKAIEADYDNEVDPEDIDEIEDVLALLDEEKEDSREI